jgi:hypothetical protein
VITVRLATAKTEGARNIIDQVNRAIMEADRAGKVHGLAVADAIVPVRTGRLLRAVKNNLSGSAIQDGLKIGAPGITYADVNNNTVGWRERIALAVRQAVTRALEGMLP